MWQLKLPNKISISPQIFFYYLVCIKGVYKGAVCRNIENIMIIKKPPIPEAIPLVRQFRNDDPTTYLTDEEQMKGMLITTLEGQPRAVDQEVLAEVDDQQNIS